MRGFFIHKGGVTSRASDWLNQEQDAASSLCRYQPEDLYIYTRVNHRDPFTSIHQSMQKFA